MDDTEDVHLLALVFVDALDLNIEERCRVDLDTIVFRDVLGETDLVVLANTPNTSRVLRYLILIFNVAELLPKLLVIDESL
jgi:hypothetical protein